MKCPYCGKELTKGFEQDPKHNKTSTDKPYGIVICDKCNNMSFFVVDFKENVHIENGNIIVNCQPIINLSKDWSDICTIWLWQKMEKYLVHMMIWFAKIIDWRQV